MNECIPASFVFKCHFESVNTTSCVPPVKCSVSMHSTQL